MQLHQNKPGSSCALRLLLLGVTQQCLYERKIHDIDTHDFKQDVIDAAVDQWRDRLRLCVCACMLVADALNTCSEMDVHLYDLSEQL